MVTSSGRSTVGDTKPGLLLLLGVLPEVLLGVGMLLLVVLPSKALLLPLLLGWPCR